MTRLFILLFLANTLSMFSQWEPSYNGLPNSRVSCMAYNGNYLFAGFYNNGVYLSTDNGNSWSRRNSGLTDTTVLCLAFQGNNLFAVTSMYRIYFSSDYGARWEQRLFKFQENFKAIAIKDSIIVIGAERGTQGDIFVSTDCGLNWTQKKSMPTSRFNALTISGNYIFAGVNGVGSGGLFVSTDAGENWTAKNNGMNSLAVKSIVAIDDKIYALSDNGIFKSTDLGDNWQKLNSDFLSNGILSFAVTDGYIFCGTQNYVFMSKDEGTTWRQIKNGLPAFLIPMVASNDDNIFAGLWGGGLFKIKKSNLIPKIKPFITKINDVTIDKNSSVVVNFSFIGEEPDKLKFLISTSDNNLIPQENIQIYGSDSLKTLSIKPINKAYGVCEITVKADDGTDSALSKFKVTVLNTRIKPSISKINDVIIDTANKKGVTIDFQIAGEVLDSLKLSLITGNPELLPLDSIRITGIDENRKLTITPVNGKTGESIVTIKITDGIDSAETSLTVRVGQFTGVSDLEAIDCKSFISPNPATDIITISNPKSLKIEIFNSLGERVDLILVTQYEYPKVRINVSSLKPGFYIVKVGEKVLKFIKL